MTAQPRATGFRPPCPRCGETAEINFVGVDDGRDRFHCLQCETFYSAGGPDEEIPLALRAAEQARLWWHAVYDEHVAAGFSDADSRLRCWDVARATDDDDKRRIAAERRHQ